MNYGKLFLSAQGRIGRQSYWIAFVTLLIAQFVSGIIPFIGPIIGLLLIYPSVCVYTKRLHDLGLSGWWQAAVYGASVVGGIILLVLVVAPVMQVSGGPRDEIAMMETFWATPGVLPLVIVLGVINFGFVIWLGAAKGQAGDNRFGRPPGAPEIAGDLEDFD